MNAHDCLWIRNGGPESAWDRTSAYGRFNGSLRDDVARSHRRYRGNGDDYRNGPGQFARFWLPGCRFASAMARDGFRRAVMLYEAHRRLPGRWPRRQNWGFATDMTSPERGHRTALRSLETRGDSDAALPNVTIYIDLDQWDARANALGGNNYSLMAGIAAKLGERLGRRRAEDGAVTLMIPRSERALGDSRANAVSFWRISPLTRRRQPRICPASGRRLSKG